MEHATQRPRCQVDGCTNAARSSKATLCPKHYHRLYRHGSVTAMAHTSGISASKGRRYRIVAPPWKPHPLAGKNGRGYEHRFVLFDAIGYGPHTCHWCDHPVGWFPKGDPHCMVVDHLNGWGDDNRPENLVPSCNPCNADRGTRARAEALRAAGFWSEHDTIAALKNGGRKPRAA